MKKFVVMSIFKVNAPILQFLAPPAPAGQNCLKRLAKIVNKRPLQHQIIIFQNWYYSTVIVVDLLWQLRKSWDQHYRIDLTAMWYIGVAGSSVCIVLVLFSTLNIIMAHICPEGNHRLHKSNHSVYCMQYACQ